MGEKEIIREIGEMIHQTELLDWRDDCVISKLTDKLSLLYSIDRPERIFFSNNENEDLKLYGRWSAGVVANDVIACGAFPVGISFDIGSSEFDNVNDLKVWISGVLDVCHIYNMKYEGGNIGIGKGISGVSWGIQENSKIIRRKGANHGDIIIATANIGTGWALRLLESKYDLNNINILNDFKLYKHSPWINLKAFKLIWELDAISCGMDITDGIVEFGYEILEQSGLGVIFNFVENRPFPIDYVANVFQYPEAAFLFEPGYDTPFAHGWCIKEGLIDKVIQILKHSNVPYTILGKTSSKVNKVYVERNFERVELPKYWDDVNKSRGSIEIWKTDILPLIEKLKCV